MAQMSGRSIDSLKSKCFDLIVVGGGIQGACLALEGSQRGLKVALLEQKDFGSATSANSLKILHGGLRYLQHLDFRRMIESIQSRRYFATFFPDLVAPLPCVIPTQKMGLKHPLPMGIALLLNDLISFNRNKGLLPQVHLPHGSLVSSSECHQLFPGLSEAFPVGGARWYDYLILNSERLTLEVVKAAVHLGAVALNYVSVSSVLSYSGKVTGLVVKDVLNPDSDVFEVKAKSVISSVGPWWNQQPEVQDSNVPRYNALRFAKAVNLIVNNKLLGDHAIGMEAADPNNAGDKRFFFMVPWQGGTMIGTTYRPVDEVKPDQLDVSQNEIRDILNTLRVWFPGQKISEKQVVFSHAGLLPIDIRESGAKQGYKLHGDTTVTHHKNLGNGGVEGLFSVKTVKYTTSPVFASRFFRQYGRMLGAKEAIPLEPVTNASRALEIKQLGLAEGVNSEQVDPAFPTTKGEIRYYCRREMASTLLDVIHRRGVIDVARKPTKALLNHVTGIMAEELDWSLTRCKQEVDQTIAFYASRGITILDQ